MHKINWWFKQSLCTIKILKCNNILPAVSNCRYSHDIKRYDITVLRHICGSYASGSIIEPQLDSLGWWNSYQFWN